MDGFESSRAIAPGCAYAIAFNLIEGGRDVILLSDLDLIKIQVETLFSFTPNGQLQYINEPYTPPMPAPRLFLGYTREGNLWRFRDDLTADVMAALTGVATAIPIGKNWREEELKRHLEKLTAVLETDAPVKAVWTGPAYCVSEPIDPMPGCVAIGPADTSLLEAHFSDWIAELSWRQPCYAVVENGNAISACFAARKSTVAAEAGVETAIGYRGQGLAPIAVSGWLNAVRNMGLIGLYSTASSNKASQAVAKKLNLRQYGFDLSLA